MASSTQRLGPVSKVWDITSDAGGQATDWDEIRVLITDAAGTIDGVDREGNAFTGFPLIQGFNPIRIQQFDNLTGPTVLFAGR